MLFVTATILAALALAGETGQPPDELQARIDHAAAGELVRVGAGVHRGGIRISRAVRLVGAPGAIIDGGGDGDVIEITSPGVEVSGLTIRGTGDNLDRENCAIRVLAANARIENNVLDDVLFGIDLKEAPGAVIRGNIIGGKRLDIARRGDGIRLWRSDRVVIENNRLQDGRDAILWYSNGITVRGNTAHHCRYGLHLMYSNDVTLEDNELSDNSVGVYFMYSQGLVLRRNRLLNNRGPSGYGIGLKESNHYTIEHNDFAGNRVGIYIDGSPFTHETPGMFRGNTFASNDVGLAMLPAVKGNVFTENNFLDNIEQVSVLGRGSLDANAFALGGRGNFWSDYTGYDLDRNGVGDYSHESQTLFENMLDREPKLRLLLFSPAQQAVELVGKALPAVSPEPKFSDPYPLMRASAGDAAPEPDRAGLVGIAGMLGILGATITGAGLWRSQGAAA